MSDEQKSANSFLAKLKAKSAAQKPYGGEFEQSEAGISASTCPNCGAGRAKDDGLTKCAYCGFEFINTTLTDGVYVKKEDNSK